MFEPRTPLTNRMRRLYHRLLSLLQILDNPPPQLMLSWNILFFDDDPEDYPGRDLFAVMSDRRLQFYNATGETLETFLDLWEIPITFTIFKDIPISMTT